ncbi:MAG: hypothetical protein Q7K42_04615 [Candidatus Diapherotrites archaeon]|nr:hypothetical protein [Candidatus Diapherotrites archaeon]
MALIGFVLSKMNLLILAIALFSIISFFTFSLSNIVLQNQAGLVVEKITKNIGTSLSSSTYCDRIVLNLPPYIAGFGNNLLFYKLKVSSVDDDSDPYNGNYLIFSMVNSADPKYILSAGKIKSSANLRVFKLEENWQEISPDEGVILDPQSVPSTDAIVAIKKIENGKQNVYIIPCSIGSTTFNVCRAEISGVINAVDDLRDFRGKEDDFACGF